jgi:hypothetical protein
VRAPAGTIVGWGDDAHGEIMDIPVGDDFVSISPGGLFAIALRADGSLAGWGMDMYRVAHVPEGNDFVAVSAGSFHALALRSDGSIVGWGFNSTGQATPPAGTGYRAISAGGGTSVAIRTDGSLIAWGSNTDVPDGNDFIAVDCLMLDSGCVALRADGTLVAWGNIPAPPAGSDFVAVALGGFHGLALRTDGSLVGWGPNSHGEATPPGGGGFVTVDGGQDFGVALRADGAVVAWGSNAHGLLQVPGGQDFVDVGAGGLFALALTGDATLPVIWSGPAGQTVLPGVSVRFRVVAGGQAPLQYQWRKDGVALADGGTIGGVTTGTLTIAAVDVGATGAYDVVVTNALGSVTSAPAPLAVSTECMVPTITTQPVGRAANEAETVLLSIRASGAGPLAYRWRKDGQVLDDSDTLVGTHSSTLTMPSAAPADAGRYDVVVTNACGSATSAPATVSVNPACAVPVITRNPTGGKVTGGKAVTLTVTAGGTPPLAYQWYKDGHALAEDLRFQGVTGVTLTIDPMQITDMGGYEVVVSNACGRVTSRAAQLTLVPDLSNAGTSVEPALPSTTIDGRESGAPTTEPELREIPVTFIDDANDPLISSDSARTETQAPLACGAGTCGAGLASGLPLTLAALVGLRARRHGTRIAPPRVAAERNRDKHGQGA